MAFKLSIDEDLFLIRTSPSLLNRLFFFKHWSYAIELPVRRIDRVEWETRLGVDTLVVIKKTKEGDEKSIPISLAKASGAQKRFIREALPKIIQEHPPMNKIKSLRNQYLKNKDVVVLD